LLERGGASSTVMVIKHVLVKSCLCQDSRIRVHSSGTFRPGCLGLWLCPAFPSLGQRSPSKTWWLQSLLGTEMPSGRRVGYARKSMVWVAPETSSFFWVGGPCSSTRSGKAISSMGCVASSHLLLVGTDNIYIFWAITGDPWYPGYKTPTIPIGVFYTSKILGGQHCVFQF
jgi:hypothetical protein